MKVLTRSAAVAAMTAAMVLTVGVGISAAHRPSPTVPTGDTTCSVNNIQLRFSAPLTSTATTAATTVTITANPLKHCSNVGVKHHRINNGHLYGLVGSVPAGATCAGVLASTASPAFASGTVKWTPAGRIARSTAVTFPAGTMSTTTDGFLQLALTGGTVSGSFASTDAALTATSHLSVAELTAACASTDGVSSVSFSGSATL